MSVQLQTKEQNNVQCAMCPNCSKLYRLTDERGESNELPTRCRRCGAPMDSEKALVFAEEQAVKEHQPSLTQLADTLRSKGQVPDPIAGSRGKGKGA